VNMLAEDDEPESCAWCECPVGDEGIEFQPEEEDLPPRWYCSFDCLLSAA